MVREWMEGKGWLFGVVEQTIPHCFIKRDLFGCVDAIAIKGVLCVALQVTSRSNMMARVNKARGLPSFERMVKALPFYVVGTDLADGKPRFKVYRVEMDSHWEDEIG